MGTIIGMGLSALIAAIGGGIAAGASSKDAKGIAREQRKLSRKQLSQDKFQFGYSALAGQRQSAETTARRRIFGREFMQALNAPKTSTF